MMGAGRKVFFAFVILIFLNVDVLAEYRSQPMLVTASTVIDRDLEFDTTAFVIKGSNIVLDLGGRTVKFNNGNIVEIPNRDFDQWVGSSPSGWTVTSGSASAVAATYFGNYDLSFSSGGILQSSPIDLKAGKTYLGFAFVQGPSDGSAMLRVRRASDGTVLSEKTLSGSTLNRGYASGGGADGDLRYKPASDIKVFLELVCAGSSRFRVGMVDIKPAFDYGVTAERYFNAIYHPDINPSWFGGAIDNITIRNGKLIQGTGQGVRCAGILFPGKNWKIENVTIEMNGINTDGILGSYPESANILASVIKSTSISVFNRMHGTGGIKLDYPTGATVVRDTTIDGVPQMGMWIYGCIQNPSATTLQIIGNTIKQRESVTEGYAIGLSGINNFEVANNNIQPYQGRGILLDAASGCSRGSKGTLNGMIHHNDILNLHEVRNAEYDNNGLECAGLRIRNWGSASEVHKNIKIYNNRISGYTDAQSVSKIYGINLSVSAPEDSIEIYENEISVTATGSDRIASAVAFQDSDLTKGNFVRVSNNILSSNGTLLLFGGNDGENAKGLLIEANTFRRLRTPTPIGKPFSYGYSVGQQLNNILGANVAETTDVDPATASNIQFEGSGAKNLVIGRHRLEIRVRGGDGTLPFPGAAIALKDKSDRTLIQNITGSTGALVFYLPQVYYSKTGTSIGRAEYADGDIFTATASVPGASPQTVSMAMTESKVITIVFQGVFPSINTPPAAPKNIRINR